MEQIRTYVKDLEEFGRVGFEIAAFGTAGGPQKREFAILNEPQATLLVTYSRNSPAVCEFKLRLVKAFYEARKAVRTLAYQAHRREQMERRGFVVAGMTVAGPRNFAESLRLLANLAERTEEMALPRLPLPAAATGAGDDAADQGDQGRIPIGQGRIKAS
jgi:hypothetical protein